MTTDLTKGEMPGKFFTCFQINCEYCVEVSFFIDARSAGQILCFQMVLDLVLCLALTSVPDRKTDVYTGQWLMILELTYKLLDLAMHNTGVFHTTFSPLPLPPKRGGGTCHGFVVFLVLEVATRVAVQSEVKLCQV